MLGIIELAVLAAVGFFVFKGISNFLSETKICPRCKGRGWWQNTRNREKCEWCNGTGQLPKDYPV